MGRGARGGGGLEGGRSSVGAMGGEGWREEGERWGQGGKNPLSIHSGAGFNNHLHLTNMNFLTKCRQQIPALVTETRVMDIQV